YKLPAMYFFPVFVEEGGLMSYGPSDADLFRRAAGYVDRILKGTKPGELPVEQPTKFDLYINLKAAKNARCYDSGIFPHPCRRGDRIRPRRSLRCRFHFSPLTRIEHVHCLAGIVVL